ncbi:glycoside hydrolase/deacetylase [Exidia glandulosa HHB12029]|uniref:chitin deacetylase n=1 Tax=Exidia glandulosa HHB12029 TaxID=1314781 RepID=A0A165NF66_EXIGL|nr:glycoside hydrolase/deacetylase [Exidia glandulosa HHB12029]
MVNTLALSALPLLASVLAARAHPHPHSSQAPKPIIRRGSRNVTLSDIDGDFTYDPTVKLTQTFNVGAKPNSIASAPGLPSLDDFDENNYPRMDKTPPTDSPEVQEWSSQVDSSGIDIPDFGPTVLSDNDDDSACAVNKDAASDDDRCWWTCGQCTRDDDVSACPAKLTFGLTFDDGPSPWTPQLLQYLDEQSLKATFFVVGSRAIEYPDILRAEYMKGHQIAVHTWSHAALTTLSNKQLIAEFGWTKKAIRDILGVTPLYFRPPYGDIDDRVRAVARAMGLTAVMWTSHDGSAFDTEDWQIPDGIVNGEEVQNNFGDILSTATSIDTGFIVLEHDLYPQTVTMAIDYIIPDALTFDPSMKVQNVISCMGQPPSEAYSETSRNRNEAQNLNLVTPYPSVSATALRASQGLNGTSKASRTGTKLPSETAPATNAASASRPADAGAMVLVALGAVATLFQVLL